MENLLCPDFTFNLLPWESTGQSTCLWKDPWKAQSAGSTAAFGSPLLTNESERATAHPIGVRRNCQSRDMYCMCTYSVKVVPEHSENVQEASVYRIRTFIGTFYKYSDISVQKSHTNPYQNTLRIEKNNNDLTPGYTYSHTRICTQKVELKYLEKAKFAAEVQSSTVGNGMPRFRGKL